MPYLTDLIAPGMGPANYMTGTSADMEWFRREPKKEKKRVHVMALGDVGSTLLLGLKLLGGDCIHTIGIFDVRKEFEARFEFEMNQVTHPGAYGGLPPVEIVPEEQLFACDVFVFCASRGVPPISETKMDVRMAQYEANAGLVELYAKKAVAAGFRGLFAVVSDPVDPLCLAAEAAGLNPARIKGYGLGVMNARAAYYAKKDARFASFLSEGAAFGPHGSDLVIANSLTHYDDTLSRELTDLTVRANVAMREMGFKPYLAPALSSGALSILATLRGEWHYSSQKFGRIFLGAKNRVTEAGIEVENPLLPQELYERIEKAYDGLCLLAEKAEKKKTSDEKARDKEKEECTVEKRTEMERRDYS
mgnify:FL=1